MLAVASIVSGGANRPAVHLAVNCKQQSIDIGMDGFNMGLFYYKYSTN
jgi:hypothetical protein